MSQGRTKRRLRRVTRKRSDRLGLQVEDLIDGSMSYIVKKYVREYRKATREQLGWTEEDLMQEIRFTLYKGLVTFDKSKGFKVETYLSTMLYYQFGNVSKTCGAKRRGRTILVDNLYPHQEPCTENDAEAWLEYAQGFQILMDHLNIEQREILYCHLVEGMRIDEMVKHIGKNRAYVVGIIKEIKELMDKHIGEG